MGRTACQIIELLHVASAKGKRLRQAATHVGAPAAFAILCALRSIASLILAFGGVVLLDRKGRVAEHAVAAAAGVSTAAAPLREKHVALPALQRLFSANSTNGLINNHCGLPFHELRLPSLCVKVRVELNLLLEQL